MKFKTSERTLLTSVLLSFPGPIVIGVGLLIGRTSTQLADFIRCTAEFLAMVVSWIIFRITNKDGNEDPIRKAKLEGIANLCVGLAMCLSGIVMVLIFLLSNNTEKGNVIPGLVIAILGAIVNLLFWFRYRSLNKSNPNVILALQSNLYCAKTLVDTCVTVVLIPILLYPASAISHHMDMAGSIIVAIYLLVNGMITLSKRKPKINPTS